MNSGVLLMNLQKLRSMNWQALLEEYKERFDGPLCRGDQCLLNAIFHHKPGPFSDPSVDSIIFTDIYMIVKIKKK